MSWKNSIDLGIVNSEEFRVLDYDDEHIILTRDEGGEDIEIETVKFHEYFLPNYCSTAHKSQGATYKGKVLLWDWNTIKQDKHLAYTACSRATALEKLVVATGIKKG
jgi:ATP-dependent exoDNAse (exonuclease V) alpha subunit